MKKDRLDKSLRDKLTDYASPLATEAAWQQLSAKRRESRKKRRIFLFFCLLGFTLLCSLGIYWQIDDASSDQPEMSILSKEQPTLLEAETQKPIDTPIQNEAGKTKKQERPVAGYSIPNAEASRSTFLSSATTQEKRISNTATTNKTDSRSSLAATSSPTSNTILENSTQKQSETILSLPQSKALSPIPMLPLLPSQAKGMTNVHTLAPAKAPRKVSRWWLGVQGGVEKRWMHIKLENTAMDAYAERRATAEEGLDQWWTGLQLRYQLNPRWFIESGAQYRRTTNKFTDSYQSIYSETESDQVVQIIKRQDGTVEEVKGSIEVEVTENGQKTIYNRSSQWTLPLYIGYHFHRYNRFGMSLVAGPELTYLSSLSGQTYEDAQINGAFIPLSQLPYRKTIWQAATRLEFSYELDHATLLNLGIQGRFGLGNMLKQEAGYRETQQSIGLMLGLVRRL